MRLYVHVHMFVCAQALNSTNKNNRQFPMDVDIVAMEFNYIYD